MYISKFRFHVLTAITSDLAYINPCNRNNSERPIDGACPLGLLPWFMPARTSRYLSPMSPPHGALVVLPRPVLELL